MRMLQNTQTEWSIFLLLAAVPIVLPLLGWINYQVNFDRGLRKGSSIALAVADRKKKKY
jgi:hypothetical protein